jgi:hypothetical protein
MADGFRPIQKKAFLWAPYPKNSAPSEYTRPGWSATILNGKSWRPNGSGSTRSGTTGTASAYPPTPRYGPTASSAACRCCNRACWCVRRAAALLWFIAGTAASAQTGPGVGYDRAALTQRSAGNTQPRCTRSACMRGATECRASRHRSIPRAIKASCRALRLIMEAPDSAGLPRRAGDTDERGARRCRLLPQGRLAQGRSRGRMRGFRGSGEKVDLTRFRG